MRWSLARTAIRSPVVVTEEVTMRGARPTGRAAVCANVVSTTDHEYVPVDDTNGRATPHRAARRNHRDEHASRRSDRSVHTFPKVGRSLGCTPAQPRFEPEPCQATLCQPAIRKCCQASLSPRWWSRQQATPLEISHRCISPTHDIIYCSHGTLVLERDLCGRLLSLRRLHFVEPHTESRMNHDKIGQAARLP